MNKLSLIASLAVALMVFLGCDEKAPPPKASTSAATPATPGPASAAPTIAGPGSVTVMNVTFAIPPGWKSVPPANAMRLAEIHAPDASGDTAKTCTLVMSTAGGDVQSNIARWQGQVKETGDQPVRGAPHVTTVEGMTVTTVELTGAYANMGETVPHANWTVRGSVIETPSGLLFLKMAGPAEQMAVMGKMMEAMIEGMKKK